MQLTTDTVDDIRELLAVGRHERVASLEWSSVSLSGAFELACCELDQQNLSETLRSTFEEWAAVFPLFGKSRIALQKHTMQTLPYKERFKSPEWEVISAPYMHEIVDIAWNQYLLRFQRSLRESGFSDEISRGLAGALEEMVDNVIRHSSRSAERSKEGIVGYRAKEGSMVFAVADVGQGVLSSLRNNPQWKNLSNSLQALNNAICNRATSRADKSYGDGFLELHRALADQNGKLRFRSGDGLLVADGREEHRRFDGFFRSPSSGFQLSVTCSLAGTSLADSEEL